MTRMFDYDGDNPLDKLLDVERQVQWLAEQHEELSGNQASGAWLLEQVSAHLVDITKAINDLFENQKILETRLKELTNENKN